MDAGILYVIAIFILLAFLCARSVCMVPPGSVRVARRLGRFSRVLEPGLHILLPVVESASKPIALDGSVQALPVQEVTTRDGQHALVGLSLALVSMDPPAGTDAVVSPDDEAIRTITGAVHDLVGTAALDELARTRSTLSLVLRAVIDEALAPRRLAVAALSITRLESAPAPHLG